MVYSEQADGNQGSWGGWGMVRLVSEDQRPGNNGKCLQATALTEPPTAPGVLKEQEVLRSRTERGARASLTITAAAGQAMR